MCIGYAWILYLFYQGLYTIVLLSQFIFQLFDLKRQLPFSPARRFR
jgi:hypothetical protein